MCDFWSLYVFSRLLVRQLFAQDIRIYICVYIYIDVYTQRFLFVYAWFTRTSQYIMAIYRYALPCISILLDLSPSLLKVSWWGRPGAKRSACLGLRSLRWPWTFALCSDSLEIWTCWFQSIPEPCKTYLLSVLYYVFIQSLKQACLGRAWSFDLNLQCYVGAEIMTSTILGVPYYSYSLYSIL